MKTIATLTLVCISFSLSAQARIVLHNNAYINIENNAYLVVDNGAPNAISTSGTGGNILSENERDVVKWNIGSNTGTYEIPWTNSNSVKIPLAINITSAGSNGGNLLLSTYRTTNMNLPWPTIEAVTNMCSSVTPTADVSLHVIDRFWRIDGSAYATKPSTTLSFGYDFANEGTGANTITESNLQAQRFNPGYGIGNYCNPPGVNVGSWQDLLFGSANTAIKQVTGVTVPAADLFANWTLVDKVFPLPVNLVEFVATCVGNETQLRWSTASEQNNDYFIVERSDNGIDFFEIERVSSVGTNQQATHYSTIDRYAINHLVYYRLVQVDVDGRRKVLDLIVSECRSDKAIVLNNINTDNQELEAVFTVKDEESVMVYLIDLNGKIVAQNNIEFQAGLNKVVLPAVHMSSGAYILSVIGEKNLFSTKFFK